VVAVVGVLALLVAGCSAPARASRGTAAPTPSATSATPAGDPVGSGSIAALKPFYGQAIVWSTCGTFQCGTVRVPVDYAEPAAGSVKVALKRSRGTASKVLGSLLINPGGPGASGVDLVDEAVKTFGKDVLAGYDLVGFDPRGVDRSSPVKCSNDAAKDKLISADFDYSTDAGIAAAKAAYAGFGQACAANTGPLLGNVDTVSAAKDLDLLRSALGDQSLSYLGYSYGTLLGATYAGLFPTRVGRMVLDGALDPSLSSADLGLGQAAGFESALRAYVTDCQSGAKCPLTGSVDDGLAQVRTLVERARRSPLPAGPARTLTGTLAFYGIAVTLYDNASWPYLTQALTAAMAKNDGSVLLRLADVYNDRNKDGSFATNSTEAFTAVSCLDGASSSDPAQMRAEAAQIQKVAPTLGYYFSYGGVVCAGWPYPPTGRAERITAPGAAPIVVIGTTNDPATPYAWAKGLASQLASGVLLTYQGEGHTAYGRSNGCILGAVDAYLLAGTVPPAGKRC
jgi:pimeloyl-ACP methyl ester carboxylesterase